MSELTDCQNAARKMLDAIDAFMAGEKLTDRQREIQDTVAKAGCYAAAAYDAYAPKGGGEYHAMTRSFLLAIIDPLSPELDYLRSDPSAGAHARQTRQQKSH